MAIRGDERAGRNASRPRPGATTSRRRCTSGDPTGRRRANSLPAAVSPRGTKRHAATMRSRRSWRRTATGCADVVPLRHQRMARSPWNYYRGARGGHGGRPRLAAAQRARGPALRRRHVLNFGLWATPERNLNFDLRDFDETLPGPFEWDVARLAASLVVAARENGLKPITADAAVPRGGRRLPRTDAALRRACRARHLVRRHARRPASSTTSSGPTAGRSRC